jgi:hypothetical protein
MDSLFPTPYHTLFFVLGTLWALPWKGAALWKAARKGQPWWFVALLVVNTVGILEIMYIFIFSDATTGIGGSKKK